MRERDETHDDGKGVAKASASRPYLRFAAMIVTSMVVMYFAMFAGTWQWGHVRFSESRIFMTITMGGSMVLVMLAWMLHMYRNTKANIAVIAIGLVLLGGGIALDRSQITVDDVDYMQAMIPHHSLAITRSERAQIEDIRVCALAVSISEAQRREIRQMSWLIDDIRANGIVTDPADARRRAAPTYQDSAERGCGSK